MITGANGFVGQHLVRELTNNHYSVLAIGGNAPTANIDTRSGVISQTVDLTNVLAVESIDFSTVSGVIHLAGLAAVGPSFDQPIKYITDNIGMEINLFEAVLKQGVRPKFLVVSSGSLYDSTASLPITEESPVRPSSPYAVSKIGQEQMAWYYTLRGFECIIARPFNHIGPGQGPGFIVPDIAEQIISVERNEASAIQVGNLDAKRDYTDVRDIARAYRLLLEKGTSGETYNICSGTARSGHEILEGLLLASRTKVNTKQDPTKIRPSDTPIIYGDHQKITKHTGWEPEINLATTLSEVIADWRSRK